MRQVPSYLIIGRGRVAAHIKHYFTLLGLPFSHWHRGQFHQALCQKIADASHVLLLISDDAIIPFMAKEPLLRQKICIHFSASTCSDDAYLAHPLMSFPVTLYDLKTYQNIPFVVDKGVRLTDILPGLDNPCAEIVPQMREYYHSLCVMAQNFTTLLWQKAYSDFSEKLGIEKNILKPILQQTMENLLSHPDKALTGPLSRGDQNTILKHLKALTGDPYYEVYQAFLKAYEKTNHKEKK